MKNYIFNDGLFEDVFMLLKPVKDLLVIGNIQSGVYLLLVLTLDCV